MGRDPTLLLAAAFVASMSACSAGELVPSSLDGGTTDGGSATNDAASSEDASDGGATDDGAMDAGARAAWCPATLPQLGAPCTPGPSSPGVFAECEYGTDPHCTTVAACSTQGWSWSAPDPSCNGNPAACPSTFDAGDTDTCPFQNVCTYADGRCACIECQGGTCGPICQDKDAGTEWHCVAWQQPNGCPNPRPLLGTACSTPGQTCGGGWDPITVCSGGYWMRPTGGC